MARDNDFSAFSALRRFAREEAEKKEAAEAEAEERCDLCGASIPPDPEHRHLMEVATREISASAGRAPSCSTARQRARAGTGSSLIAS